MQAMQRTGKDCESTVIGIAISLVVVFTFLLLSHSVLLVRLLKFEILQCGSAYFAPIMSKLIEKALKNLKYDEAKFKDHWSFQDYLQQSYIQNRKFVDKELTIA